MIETKIGKAVITHADTLIPQAEVEREKQAKADEKNQKLSEIDGKKDSELTLTDINYKLDLILERLGIG